MTINLNEITNIALGEGKAQSATPNHVQVPTTIGKLPHIIIVASVDVPKFSTGIVHSNDVFQFEETGYGSTRVHPLNRLYDGVVTLNPTPKQANWKVSWRQLVGNDVDIGWYYNAVIMGMYGKMMAEFTTGLTAAAASAKYVPAYLRKSGWSSENWTDLVLNVSAANGVPRGQLFGFGDGAALAHVLPGGTPSDAALTYQLGPEWMRNGFIGVANAVPLYEVQRTLAPGRGGR